MCAAYVFFLIPLPLHVWISEGQRLTDVAVRLSQLACHTLCLCNTLCSAYRTCVCAATHLVSSTSPPARVDAPTLKRGRGNASRRWRCALLAAVQHALLCLPHLCLRGHASGFLPLSPRSCACPNFKTRIGQRVTDLAVRFRCRRAACSAPGGRRASVPPLLLPSCRSLRFNSTTAALRPHTFMLFFRRCLSIPRH
jgi:hypothetical protein